MYATSVLEINFLDISKGIILNSIDSFNIPLANFG